MSQDYGDWDDLGRNIQEIIDRAVNSRDYQKLNQTVSQIIGRAVDRGSEAVRKAMDASARSAAAPRCRQEPAPGSAQNIARLYGSTGNQTAAGIAQSVENVAQRLSQAQIVFIPGGFSGGDEPDGSAKFITAFFRNPAIKEQVTKLLEQRDGLMCGICNGFQALIKLGLVPFGKIIDTDDTCPTLTFNTIARHQSRIVRTRVASNKSPWLSLTNVGDVYNVPISHGEGKFLASAELVKKLAANGQIATQYVDLAGNPTMDAAFNPNGSVCAIEGITSPDGRVFGKMGHSERIGAGLYKNVPGEYDIQMFKAAVKYFK